jgi:hypothetical protein
MTRLVEHAIESWEDYRKPLDKSKIREEAKKLALSDSKTSQALASTVMVAYVNLLAAAEMLRAVSRCLQPPVISIALHTCARACLEASCKAWWLMDTNVNSATRVERLLTLFAVDQHQSNRLRGASSSAGPIVDLAMEMSSLTVDEFMKLRRKWIISKAAKAMLGNGISYIEGSSAAHTNLTSAFGVLLTRGEHLATDEAMREHLAPLNWLMIHDALLAFYYGWKQYEETEGLDSSHIGSLYPS